MGEVSQDLLGYRKEPISPALSPLPVNRGRVETRHNCVAVVASCHQRKARSRPVGLFSQPTPICFALRQVGPDG
jgi:hypothetical protein